MHTTAIKWTMCVMSAQHNYRHGLVNLLLNNILGRETLLQEREFHLGGNGSVHGHKEVF